jgi:hypothetical protein
MPKKVSPEKMMTTKIIFRVDHSTGRIVKILAKRAGVTPSELMRDLIHRAAFGPETEHKKQTTGHTPVY